MLETENMQATYTYGDGKSGDATNFGIFKQNWGMIRESCSQFKGQSASQANNGAALNNNLAADVKCLNESQAYYGLDRWFAGHRNGSSGLSNPNTADINQYKTGVLWIRSQIDSAPSGRTDDTRWWADIVAI